ncbi:unnamed protein product [Cylicocyclus nassatus]|uniref:Uncharacterized protein n=1 Tax=Cylicocyclus nassatus TaxID=53992 RepID=A0AA36GR87_CYLNA|nr:unnamed protein product [Cylicocyclus nassatus]
MSFALQLVLTLFLLGWLSISCSLRGATDDEAPMRPQFRTAQRGQNASMELKKTVTTTKTDSNETVPVLAKPHRCLKKQLSAEDFLEDKTQAEEIEPHGDRKLVSASAEKWIPYPEVKEPTKAQRKRRAAQLEQDKLKKIAEGYYQPRSDMDDTLDQVESLDMERSEARFKWLKVLPITKK